LFKFFRWVILSSIMYYYSWRRLWFLHVFIWQFTLTLTSMCILLTLASLASLHIFCLSAIESCCFLNRIHCCYFAQLEHKATLTLPKRTTIYKILIFILYFLIIIIFTKKKVCKCFVLLTNVIVTQKNGVSFQNRWLPPPKKMVWYKQKYD
jgi:hypothetical protein